MKNCSSFIGFFLFDGDDLLSADLQGNFNSAVAPRYVRLHIVLWVRTKSFLSLLFRGTLVLGLWASIHK